MPSKSNRLLVLLLLGCSLALLIPGIYSPVLTIRGVLTREGIAHVTPLALERGLTDETVGMLRGMMNPQMLALLELTGGDLRKTILERLGPQLSAALQQGAADIQVFQQTRSILGTVEGLYEARSPAPATLILLFSVIVPLGKAALVAWAMFLRNSRTRDRTLRFVEAIAKWSMADVFVVALFVTYLAAHATAAAAATEAAAPPLLVFTAEFGPGFYWFTAYCLFSLASQQITVRLLASSARLP